MLRILCLCRLAGRRANRESRLIPPRVGNITRISFIAHLPCVEGVYESVPVLGRFLQNGAAQAPCRSVSCAPVDTAARIMMQAPPREPEGSVPWRGRFMKGCEILELLELKTKLWNIFSVQENNFCSAVMDAAKNEKMLAAYCDLVEDDLNTDELQKIFQYYYADRKEKCQDYTPKSIAKLCAVATEKQGDVVYDLCAGSGAMTIQKWAQNHRKAFVCEELDERVIPFLLFNLAVRNICGYVLNRNALTLEFVRGYKLTPGDRFSDIEEIAIAPEILADEIISNPPYNIKWDAPAPMLADSRFQGKSIPPASNANFAFVLTALSRMKPGGSCAFVLPCGILSSEPEKEVREYLIDAGMVERVIVLPDKMFEATSIPTCVIVFSAGNKAVKFYDCRQKAIQEQRDQNGQFGGASHENRTYHKMVNALPDDVIGSVCGVCENIPEFSQEISIEQIAKNGYNLIPSRYIPFQEREEQHRPYADIMADINRISRERSIIKITINETWAKELGLFDAAKSAEQEESVNLDKTFSLLGGHYESKRYLTLTKSKELKIENQDKEILSSLINFFLPMWKQHVFYLNQEENRLLAELRDAMIPELMNGKLKI